MITAFPPVPPVAYTFVQTVQCDAQRWSRKNQCEANVCNTIGTQENRHQPQRVILNERLANVLKFAMEYQKFSSLKPSTEAVFVESCDLYT